MCVVTAAMKLSVTLGVPVHCKDAQQHSALLCEWTPTLFIKMHTLALIKINQEQQESGIEGRTE